MARAIDKVARGNRKIGKGKMINILIVEDKAEKQQEINQVVNMVCDGYDDIYVGCATDIGSTKREMGHRDIQIMILDLHLPINFIDGPVFEGGIKLINEIKASKRYKYPAYVISLSEYVNETEIFKRDTGEIHKYIIYDGKTKQWMTELEQVLKAIIPTCKEGIPHRNYENELAVICALSEELDYVKKSLLGVVQIKVPFDDFIYFKGHYEKDGKNISVIATCSTQMGMVAASTLTTKVIYNFCPKYIVMTGIAAGVKNKVGMGDAIIAEYTWDYGAGKEVVDDNGDKKHKNTIQQIHIDAALSNMVRQLQLDEEFAKDVKKNAKMKKPKNKFKIVMGAVATGASVIADPDKVKDIIDNQVRDLVAIEMEVYGVYYAAKWSIAPRPKFIAIKSVCDYADTKKSDDFHEYASYTSVRVFEKLAKEYFVYEPEN